MTAGEDDGIVEDIVQDWRGGLPVARLRGHTDGDSWLAVSSSEVLDVARRAYRLGAARNGVLPVDDYDPQVPAAVAGACRQAMVALEHSYAVVEAALFHASTELDHGAATAGQAGESAAAGGVAAMVAEFHEVLGQCFGDRGPGTELRARLHGEEHRELCDALHAEDRAGIARELADVVYVAYGTAHALGLPLDAVLAEVHRANMSKRGADGAFTVDDHGKVLKGPNYRPPDIDTVLAAAPAPSSGPGVRADDGQDPR